MGGGVNSQIYYLMNQYLFTQKLNLNLWYLMKMNHIRG